MTGTTLLEEFSKLDESEQIQIVEDMWDKIAERKGLPPSPPTSRTNCAAEMPPLLAKLPLDHRGKTRSNAF